MRGKKLHQNQQVMHIKYDKLSLMLSQQKQFRAVLRRQEVSIDFHIVTAIVEKIIVEIVEMNILLMIGLISVLMSSCEAVTNVEQAFIEHEITPQLILVAPPKLMNVKFSTNKMEYL